MDIDAIAQDHIFCILQILEKNWEYNEAMHQLFKDFKKAYDSVSREVLYHILIEFCIPMKLVRLIKMCLNETSSSVWLGKYLSDLFQAKNGFKQVVVLLPMLFNFASEYVIRRVQVNQDILKSNGTHQLLIHAADDKNTGQKHTYYKEKTQKL